MSRAPLLSSVHNALRVLDCFSATERELGVSELARRLAMGKSTVHRLCTTLAAGGLLEHNPVTGRYRLGLHLYELGALVGAHMDLHEAAGASLLELRNRTGETAQDAFTDFAKPAQQQIPGAGGERSNHHAERGEADISRMQLPGLRDAGLWQRKEPEDRSGGHYGEQIKNAMDNHAA